MRELALRQTPARLQVLREVFGLLDRGDDRRVDGLLVGGPGLRVRLLRLGFALSEELLLRGGLALGGRLGEVRVVDLLVDLEVAELNLGGGGDNVGLVDPAERDTVDLVGAGHKQQSALELLQEDDAPACEAASKEDEDGAGGDGRAQLRGLGVLAALLGLADVLSRVESWRLLGGDKTLATVVGTANSDLLGGGGLSSSRLLRLFQALEEAAAGVDLRAGQPSDAGDEFLAAGHCVDLEGC